MDDALLEAHAQLRRAILKRSAEKRFGLRQLALVLQDNCQIVDRRQGVRVRDAQLRLVTLEQSAVKRLGLRQLALILKHKCQMMDGRYSLWARWS